MNTKNIDEKRLFLISLIALISIGFSFILRSSISMANSPVSGLLAATLWGTGVCFLWPTMLATTSERFPEGGALALGLMGTSFTRGSDKRVAYLEYEVEQRYFRAI